MDKVAVFSGTEQIYWHAIIMVAAISASIILFFLLRCFQKCRYTGVLWVTAVSIPLGLLFARAIYWYFRQELYSGVKDIIAKMSDGGYCLYGAALGVILSILIVNFVGRFKSLPEFFDAAAPAAALGVCIGRLASWFSSADRGKVIENERFHKFPFTVYDSTQNQWCLATFFFEALAAGIICVILIVLFIRIYAFDSKKNYRRGDLALLLALMYGSAQCVLESLRVDSLYLVSLGFVRVSQIISAILVGAVLVVFSIRLVRKYGFKWNMAALWGACAALLGVAFYMELRLTSEVYVRNYTVMSVCMFIICSIGIVLYFLTAKKLEKPKERKNIKFDEAKCYESVSK